MVKAEPTLEDFGHPPRNSSFQSASDAAGAAWQKGEESSIADSSGMHGMQSEDSDEDDRSLDETDQFESFKDLPADATQEEEYDALTSQALNPDGTPKRPMNAFMIWGRRRRPQLSDLHPTLRTGDISKLLSDEWASMEKSEKEFYLEAAKRLKDAFNARWPTYVYKRRPNNTRRKRKKADGKEGSGQTSTAPSTKKSKSGAVSVPSAKTSSIGRSKVSPNNLPGVEQPPQRPSASTLSSGAASSSSSAEQSYSSSSSSEVTAEEGSAPYGSYATSNPGSLGQASWSWSSGSAPPDQTFAARARASGGSRSSMDAPAPDLKANFAIQQDAAGNEEEIVFRSGGSPEPDLEWGGAADTSDPTGFSLNSLQGGSFGAGHSKPISHWASYPIPQFSAQSSRPGASHSAYSMPALPGFPAQPRGSWSSFSPAPAASGRPSSSSFTSAGTAAPSSMSAPITSSSPAQSGYAFGALSAPFHPLSSSRTRSPGQPSDQQASQSEAPAQPLQQQPFYGSPNNAPPSSSIQPTAQFNSQFPSQYLHSMAINAGHEERGGYLDARASPYWSSQSGAPQ